MGITLGALALDPLHTHAQEKLEEVGGRDERSIEIQGLLVNVADAEAQLDAIVNVASAEDYSAALSLRDGRRMWVRRAGFTREVSAQPLAASFTLQLSAREPFEESEVERATAWQIRTASAIRTLNAQGNMNSPVVITLVAVGTVKNPSFSDGVRTIAYAGTVADGQSLVLDGVAERATLEGVDVTPYTSGLFPVIAPSGTALAYADGPGGSHAADVTVAFRDRWW